MTWAWVALGGAIGALVRDGASNRRGAVRGTDLVNRVGAVLLGLALAARAADVLARPGYVLVGIGIGGGMTTFSTLVVQVVDSPGANAHGADWVRLARETVIGLVLAAVSLWSAARLLP